MTLKAFHRLGQSWCALYSKFVHSREVENISCTSKSHKMIKTILGDKLKIKQLRHNAMIIIFLYSGLR